MAFWVSFHLLGDHAPRRLELPPLAVLELHEARHEGAAGEAVGPVQPPDPGAQRVPQELEPLAVHAFFYVHAKEGHALLAGRGALRHVRGVRPVQALPDLHARGGSSPSGRAAPGESRSPRGAGSSPPRRRTPSSGSRGTSRAASSAASLRCLPAGRPPRRGRWAWAASLRPGTWR